MALYQRGGVWWLDVYHEGTRLRRSTGEADWRKAKEAHDRLRAECHRRPRGRHSLADALALWRAEQSGDKRQDSWLKRALEYHGDTDLAEVTADSIGRAFGTMAPGSFNRYISILKRALALAQARGWIMDLPKVSLRKAPKRDRWLTAEEWTALRAELMPHHRAMADLMIATGLRVGNVRRLEWRHVDLKARALNLPPSVMKNGRPLAVPLTRAACSTIRAQAGQHPSLVFPGPQGGVMAEWSETFKRAAERAGLPGVTIHTLRHTWASWHVMNGTPLEVLQRLGGWSSITMVQRYAHLAPGFAEGWAENAKPRSITQRKKRA